VHYLERRLCLVDLLDLLNYLLDLHPVVLQSHLVLQIVLDGHFS
jgi:hypothetical protein